VGEQKQKEAEAAAYDQGEQAAVTLAEGRGLDEALKEIDKGTLGNFNPTDKERLRNRARLVSSQRGAEAADGLVNGVLSGQINSGAAIDAVDNPHLTPKLREEAKQWIEQRSDYDARKAIEEDKAQNGIKNAVKLRSEIYALDPTEDKDHTQYFTYLRRIGETTGAEDHKELNRQLAEKYDLEPKDPKQPPEIKRLTTKLIDGAFDEKEGPNAFMYKDYKILRHQNGEPIIDSKTGQPKIKVDSDGQQIFKWRADPAKLDRSATARAKVEKEVRIWAEANPEKANDPKAVRDKIMSALPEGTRMKALDVFQRRQEAARASQPQASTAPGAVSDSLLATVKGIEGFQPHAYGDYKQISVGYGTRAKSHDEQLNEAQATDRLRSELSMHAGRIDSAARKTGVSLTPGQRDALISFDFNTGEGAHLLESSGGNLGEVQKRMALYTHADHKELPGLVARRKQEIAMFGL
jgi:GH24 family phage-related lysozyme (muramidase)